MLVTDYHGPFVSVFLSLVDRDTSSDMNTPPAPQCSLPVRAALRWATPPVSKQVNVCAGMFDDDAGVEAIPTVLTQPLDDEQPMVLRGISESTKALHVADALAGTGKSHLARCLINRWGLMRGSSLGCLVTALRTSTLRQELLDTLLSDNISLFALL